MRIYIQGHSNLLDQDLFMNVYVGTSFKFYLKNVVISKFTTILELKCNLEKSKPWELVFVYPKHTIRNMYLLTYSDIRLTLKCMETVLTVTTFHFTQIICFMGHFLAFRPDNLLRSWWHFQSINGMLLLATTESVQTKIYKEYLNKKSVMESKQKIHHKYLKLNSNHDTYVYFV